MSHKTSLQLRAELSVLLAVVVTTVLALLSLMGEQAPVRFAGAEPGAAPAVATPAGERALRLALRWQLGQRYRYAVRYTTRQQAAFGATADDAPIGGRGQLEADLVLTPITLRGDVTTLVARLDEVRSYALDINGQAAFADLGAAKAVVEGYEAEVDLDIHGQVHGFRVNEADPELFKNLMQSLVLETSVTLDSNGAREWNALEGGLHGRAETSYRVVGHDETATTVRKTRREYASLRALVVREGVPAPEQELSYEMTATLHDRGHLLAVEVDESLRVAQGKKLDAATSLSLRLRAIDKVAQVAPRTVATTERDPHVFAPSAAARRNALVYRTDGLTFADLEAELKTIGGVGALPDHSRFLWRAAGLLRLHPELCERLVALVGDSSLGFEGKVALLDLLAGVGHAEGRAALVAALSRDVVRADPDYPAMVARLGLVREPDEQTVSFTQGLRAAAPSPTRDVATLSLGAAAGYFAERGETARAVTLVHTLMNDYAKAASASERVTLLGALGNAARSESESIVVGGLTDGDPEVRGAAANALRGLETETSRAALIKALGDNDAQVQRAALLAVGTDAFASSATGETLASLVTSGRVDASNWQAVVAWFSSHEATPAQMNAVADYLLARTNDADLIGNIRGLQSLIRA